MLRTPLVDRILRSAGAQNIVFSLSHHYNLIITLLSHYYHVIIMLLSHYYYIIVTLLSPYYHIIITLLSLHKRSQDISLSFSKSVKKNAQKRILLSLLILLNCTRFFISSISHTGHSSWRDTCTILVQDPWKY